jgi:hypothetical protein
VIDAAIQVFLGGGMMYAAMILKNVTRMVIAITILTIPHYGIEGVQGNLSGIFFICE